MLETARACAVTALVVLVVSLLVGCGGDAPDDAATSPPQTADTLTVGDATMFNYGRLDDPDGVGALKVTVTRVEDPMRPPDGDRIATSKGPGAGRRFVAVHTRLENIGDRTYADSLYGSTQLVTDQGDIAEGVQLIGWSCESAFEGSIPTGARTEGCEVYELPDSVQPDRFVVTEGEQELASWNL